MINLNADTINISGTVNADGGRGGTSNSTGKGGGGGGGRIALNYHNSSINPVPTVIAGAGGNPGATNGVLTQTMSVGPGTATVTKSPALDLSSHPLFKFWIKSSRTGQYMQMQMGESSASENTYNITINSADTWEQKTWDISGIADASKDAITKVALAVTDATSGFTAYLDDLNAEGYPASGTVSGLIVDASATSTWGALSWSADTAPAGTSVKFRVRTASSVDGSNNLVSPTDWSLDVTTSPTTLSVTDNRYAELEITLATTDLSNTPTLNEVLLTYVRNAPPEFDSTFGGGVGVTVSENANGTATITYSVRDEDTNSNNTSVASGSMTGKIRPIQSDNTSSGFEYNTGSGWNTITTTYLSNGTADIDRKSVDTTVCNPITSTCPSYTQYTAIWDAKSQIPGVYTASAQVRVTANDNEGVSNTATATVSNITIDTKNPDYTGIVPIALDAANNQLTLKITDDSATSMKISNNSGLTADGSNDDSGSFIAYGTDANSDGYGDTPLSATVTKSWTPTSGTTSSVYAQYKDLYGNTTSTVSATTPVQPQNMVIRDLSNVATSEYRIFVVWQETNPAPTPGFKHYRVMRSTNDESGYAQYGSLITDIETNYILDETVVANTTYYYKIYVEDNDGNRSKYSASVYDKADGQGGTDATPPTITVAPSAGTPGTQQATITWTTDELSNSTVRYSTAAYSTDSNWGTPSTSATMAASHSITLTGLTPSTTYRFRISSTDPSSNSVTDDNSGAGYSFTTATGPTISTVSVTDITNTTAQVVWTTDASSNSVVDYSTNSDLSSSSTTTVSTPATSHAVPLSGLTPGTKYFFQVRSADAVNPANISTNNNGENYYYFTTINDTTAPVISAVDAVNKGETFASIIWTTDEAATSQVEYGLTSAYGATTTENTDLVTSHGVRLTGLTANTTHHYRVISKDGSNNSTTGGDNTFSTTLAAGVDATAPVVSTVTISPIYSTQATVTWTTNEQSTSIVDYSTDLSFASSKQDTSIGTSHSVTITGLTPNTAYKARVRSVDSAENSVTDDNSSAGYPFTTTPGAVISAVSVSSTSGVSATVTWTTDISSNSYVDYSTNSSLSNSATASSDLSATKHSINITNLTPASKYYFRVRSIATIDSVSRTALDDNGGSYYYFSTTLDTTAPVISAVDAVNKGETFASIIWTTDEAASSQVEYGLTTAYGSSTTENTDSVTSHGVRLTGLTSDTTYHYRVISKDASNNSATSADDVFTTVAPATALTGGGGGGGEMKDVTSPTISGIIAKVLDSASALVSWTTNELSTGFVEYKTSDQKVFYIDGDFDPSLEHKVEISRLKPSTAYTYRVASQDSYGNLARSLNRTFKTEAEEKLVTASSPETTKPAEEKAAEQKAPEQKPVEEVAQTTPTAPVSPITPASPVVAEVVTQAKSVITEGIKAILEVGGVDPAKIVNDALEQASKAILPPRIVGPLPTIELSPTSAVIRWNTDKRANSLVAFAEVQDYKQTREEPYTQVVGNYDERVTLHEVRVLNLKPATTYYYQVRSSSFVGKVGTSDNLKFTTPAETPVISQPMPKIIGENSATITWSTNLPTDSIVRYAPIIGGKAQSDQSRVQGSPEFVTSHAVTITGLNPGTRYDVEVISKDAFGNQVIEKLFPINTGEDKEAPVISQIRTSTAVVPGKTITIQTIISWKTDEPATSQVTWQEGSSENKALERTTPLLADLTTDHLVVITQFRPATVYRFSAQSKDAAGNETTSRTFTILTPRQDQTVLQIIVKNFQDIFPFTK
ncbi:MAG: fibronectin type III domain-containing protein [Candidatus Spechtbacteria bacterium]|nr:fibronectin type III domain-containing protein [Candidatus Spechtbacteria bacterium]